MADDDRSGSSRPRDAYGRPLAAPKPSGDPLAELARLIGQQNESGTSYRQNGMRPASGQEWTAPDPFAQQDSRRAPSDRQRPQSNAGPFDNDPAASSGQYDDRYGEQTYRQAAYPHSNNDPHYSDQQYADQQYSDQRYDDGRYADPHHADAQYGAGGYPDQAQTYGDPNFAQQPYAAQPGYRHEQDRYANSPDAPAYGAPSFVRGDREQSYAAPYYGGMTQGARASDQDDRAPRRRGSIVTVLAVLALAVVGTAGAFGYRAMFGSSGAPVPPPVIKADTSPTKIVPASDANAKPIQDRIGVQTERIVPREEQPIELRDPARAGSPRVIFPNLAGQNQPGSSATGTASVGTAGPVSGTAEPKRVRTVAIKPEQPTETASTRNAAAQQRGASQAESDSARAQALAPTSNTPLPLSPNAQQQQQPQPQRQASRTNPAAAFPAPISGGGAVSGAYAVQVTSQRSESDAQASYRSLQAQFPSVLGNRQPVIKRADLGDKGVYYRAQIPFGSQGEASEFCGSLKTAGGQCVVQRN